MIDTSKFTMGLSPKARLGLGGAALLALGLAGGAGATKLTRPAVEMAPVMPVAIATLPNRSGPVTVKGKVAEVYGDRFTVTDGSGKTMVDAREGDAMVQPGATLLVQGRYDDGQLRASFLVDGNGRIASVGPAGRPPHGPKGPGARGPAGPDSPPPPPANGCPPPPAPSAAAAPQLAPATK
ncbi:hypothetical protein FPZ24_03825 [Sphingomonas panacisoli]|uniref:Bacterial OB-fold domain-containing protein n=1 Tax=Sphingomonas panacisoli TaxID=1813879 RepID=A0A5B8LGD1_9SPHN|nr:hypothetical protein [Sphingomonas panacisoli]QDZ06714.1 hypothetical protein FPZ24_03825 [Sphingomonas panacisoli]